MQRAGFCPASHPMNTSGRMGKGLATISTGRAVHRMTIRKNTCPAQAKKIGANPGKPYE
jgi:hypothetical protein